MPHSMSKKCFVIYIIEPFKDKQKQVEVIDLTGELNEGRERR